MANEKDIAPELLETLQAEFKKAYEGSTKVRKILAAINSGGATYAEANDFAIEVGELLAEVFRKNLSSAVLPDGRMYYNIASRILDPLLENNYAIAADAAVRVQQELNNAAGIGLNAVSPELNRDRIDGIINIVSGKDDFDAIAYMLQEPVVNFTQSAVDDTVKANVDFQGKSGLRPKVIRKVAGNCCEWCAALSGTYTYPDVPRDVYRRHKYCRCTVTYDPGNGKVQDVWSKQWKTQEESDKIEERKRIGIDQLTETDRVALNQYKSFESYLLNESLREGTELTQEQLIMMERLDQALEKLPIYEGTTYRSLDKGRIRDLDAFWEKYQVGNKVVENAYTSTSTEVYDDSFEIQMIITGKSGCDMRVYTDLESEIVYPRNTRFTVMKREGNTLWLEEI